MRMRSLKAIAVAAAAVVAAGIGLSSPAQAAVPQMQFTYIVYDSPGSDTRSNASLNAEYVRITNNGPANNLKNWTLKDAAGHTFTFPSLSIAKGARVWVHTGKGANTRSDLYWGSGIYIWNNPGDTAALRSASGKLYDTCKWTKAGSGHTAC
jgi:lamin tail-like protein